MNIERPTDNTLTQYRIKGRNFRPTCGDTYTTGMSLLNDYGCEHTLCAMVMINLDRAVKAQLITTNNAVQLVQRSIDKHYKGGHYRICGRVAKVITEL